MLTLGDWIDAGLLALGFLIAIAAVGWAMRDTHKALMLNVQHPIGRRANRDKVN